MNKIIDVKEDIRLKKRNLSKVFNGDFIKILTEIILNADDSYKRLEDEGAISGLQTIEIYLNRSKRLINVIDQAEGMSKDDISNIFSVYGADNNRFTKTSGVRGLFGQGAGDVLYFSAYKNKPAQLISIKDGQITKCKFIFKDDKQIKISSINGHLNQQRLNFKIAKNGTNVQFGVDEEVFIPSKKTIKKKIEEFYMLRYILTNKNRRIILYDDNKEMILSSKEYSMYNLENFEKDIKIRLSYESKYMDSFLSVYVKKDAKSPTQFLIKDEKDVVYDNTYFGYETYPGMRNLTGELVIPGIGELIRELLNSSDPKELLTATRDGFDKRNKFTTTMYELVGKELEKQLDKFNKKRESLEIDITHNKVFNDIMKQINSYYRELELSSIEGINRGTNPPQDGISFARSVISITKNKTYDLKIYINSEQVTLKDTINLSVEDNQHIVVETKRIFYEQDEIKENGMVIKSVILKGISITKDPIILTATCKEHTTYVNINVVEEKIIYPTYGLEFSPNRRDIGLNKDTTMALFIDSEVVSLGSEITIQEKRESALFAYEYKIEFTKKDIVVDTIGKLSIDVKSSSTIQQIYLNANFEDINSRATVYVKDKKKQQIDGKSGILNNIQIKYEPEEMWQSTMDPKKGILYINGSHIINISNMGQLGDLNPKYPKFKSDQNKYLLELISEESAKRIAEANIDQKNKNFGDGKEYINFIQEHKTNIYKIIIDNKKA